MWYPPAHIEAAFEHDNDSGIMISIRISADQYWQKVSHLKTGDELGFRVLEKLSTAMLYIPHGNADSEQIFPQLELTKGAATRYDSPARSLPIALYMGQS